MQGLIKDRYELLETLGAGGEGRVVKALDHQHGRFVALKIRRICSDATREELLGEARTLLAVPPHPALPLVREDFFDGDDYVVAMDWVDGTDLARLLRDRGRPGLAASSVLAYLAATAEALTHLHSQDPPVVHGDVKPGNLILTRGGRVKLVDFGMSSAPDVPRRRAGTPGFRAPELVAGDAPSRAADIYSLAATAFALLSGAAPAGVLPSWEGIDPLQAEQLESVIRLGMATDPARRPATAGEFVERLRAGWGAALPTGVTTFCLSDIEGSTAMWDADPGSMAEALVRHDALIADCVEAHGGHLIKSMGEGDSTVSAFDSALRALDAVLAATRAFADEQWPGGLDVRVRFGLHTGEAERRDADYFGPAVNLAARLRGQADGGQIFLSAATTGLVAAQLPAGCELVDLGLHRLRGLGTPERIHAVKGPGLSTPLPVTDCPYRGLLSFEPEDREFFFGREAVVDDLLSRLAPGRLLAVVGASGSGKSSALRAGVVAAARAGELPGIDRVCLLTPGAEPRLDVAGDPGELVVVDQFEELFTLCDDESQRHAYIDALLSLTGPVAIGVRADLYGKLGSHAELARAVADNQLLLGPMTDAELRRAVTEPARLAGLRLETGLVELVLRDVAGEPGALPLLSHALRATWERRDGRTMTVEGYHASGGVASAIAQTADAVVDALPAGERPLVRNMFLRLTELGEGAEDTRRRVDIDDLVPQGASRNTIQALLERLAEARLLTLGEGTAEVAHEVLIRKWPALRTWLDEDREGIRLHRQLGAAARLWDVGGREPSDLYRGARLGAALEWADGHREDLNATERAFLEGGVAAAERERRAQLRANRRLRALLAGAGVLLVAAVVAGLLALRQGDHARESARTAAAQRLGAQAQIDERLDRSLLLAQAGRALDDSVATRGYLLSALVRHPAAIGVINGGGVALSALALSAGGGQLAVGQDDGTLVLIDPRSRRRNGASIRVNGSVQGLDFSPDGTRLAVTGPATATADAQSQRVKLLDAATGRTVREIAVGPYPGDPRQLPFVDARFTADGQRVVVTINGDLPGPYPAYLRRYDARTGRPLGRTVRVGRQPAFAAPAVPARRDRLLISGDDENATFVVDAATLRVQRRISRGAFAAALAPDGRSAALGGKDGSVTVVDLRTGEPRTLAGRHEDPVSQLAFSADGRTLTSTGGDGRVLLWDLRSGDVRETLTGHSGRITSLAVSDDGRTLYSAGRDGRTIVWDIAGDRRLAQPFVAGNAIKENFPPAAAISPDGRRFAAGLRGGGVRVSDALTLRALRDLPGIAGRLAAAVEYSPDGRTIAITGTGGRVEVRDARSGRRVRPPLPGVSAGQGPPGGKPGDEPTWDAQALGFSPDGGRLAVADLAGNLRVLDLSDGRVRRGPRLPTFAISVSFSPDGKLLAIGLDDQGTELRDSHTLRLVARLRSSTGDDADRWVRFSPDGRLLAISSGHGYTQLWDLATRRRSGGRLTGHTGSVLDAEFSPDGRTLATTGIEGAVILWDVPSRRALGTLIGRESWVTARFTPDGRQLFVLHDTGDAERWDVDPDAWSQHACSVAGREPTRAEWDAFVPDQARRSVCAP